MFQCVAVCCSVLQRIKILELHLTGVWTCSACVCVVAVCCSVLQYVTMSVVVVLQCVAVCCSVLQRIKLLELFLTGVYARGVYACVRVCAVVVCWSVLQCMWWCCCGVLQRIKILELFLTCLRVCVCVVAVCFSECGGVVALRVVVLLQCV